MMPSAAVATSQDDLVSMLGAAARAAAPGSAISLLLKALLHRRERRRLQDGVADRRDDRPVALGLGALGDPFGIAHERRPFLLALGQRLPLQEIVQILVRLADHDRPEPGLANAVLRPERERGALEALQQRRQPAAHAAIDAEFVDQALLLDDLGGIVCGPPALALPTVHNRRGGEKYRRRRSHVTLPALPVGDAMTPALPRLFEMLVQDAPDAIVYADSEGIIRFWNRAAEATGQSLDIIIPENPRARHWAGYRAVMKSGVSRYGAGDLLAVPGLRQGGERISLEFTIVPIHGDDGRLCGIAAILRDVSTRFAEIKELRRQVAAAAPRR